MTTSVALPTVRTDPDDWVQQPDGQWERVHAPRTLGAVWDDIVAALPAYGVDLGAFDYAGPQSRADRHRLFPQGYRWIACFAVRGCSEGWYVHVEAVQSAWVATEEMKVLEPIFLAKTFAGWETAHALTNALAKILDQ
ncbi:MAG: hypothetical protein ACYDBB_04725 [Armatimonadota bacterium]